MWNKRADCLRFYGEISTSRDETICTKSEPKREEGGEKDDIIRKCGRLGENKSRKKMEVQNSQYRPFAMKYCKGILYFADDFLYEACFKTIKIAFFI